jgi:hypothetical protein
MVATFHRARVSGKLGHGAVKADGEEVTVQSGK